MSLVMNANDFCFKVCVKCWTYNHAPYIIDALNGFIIQKTSFPYVCIIVDDASSDGEPDVIKNYLSKHFDLVDNSLVRNEETNDYVLSFARHRTNKNCFFAIYFLKYNHHGKKNKSVYFENWVKSIQYHAICEGDDYWTDPLKLQKQIDFLGNHTDYSMCFHRAATLDYIGNGSWLRCFDIEDRDYSSDELFSKWIVPTNSIVYRSECLDYPIIHRERILNGDIVVVLSCSHTGKVRGMSDYMSVYRIQPGGLTYDPLIQKERTLKYPEHFECIQENFPLLSKDVIEHAIGTHYYYRSLIQTDIKLQKKDLLKAKLLFPEFIKQKKRELRKQHLKRILHFPINIVSA